MKNNKLLLIIIAAILVVAAAVTVILVTRTNAAYELNEKGDGYILADYKGWGKNIKIRSQFKGLPVVAIGDNAFEDSKVASVTVPDGVKTIGFKAFYNCQKLVNVYMPNGITDIGVAAFGKCTALTEIAIPEGVTSIRAGLFEDCSALLSVQLPKSMETIHYLTFMGCHALNSISVDAANPLFKSVDNCLIEKESKTLVIGTNSSIIPSDGSVTAIGEGAFFDLVGIRSIVIPEAVKTIGTSAFENCAVLKTVEMKGVDTIGSRAFFGCSRLETLTLGASLSTVSEIAFFNTTNLKNLYYLGTPEFFASVEIAEKNDTFNNATLYFYAETKPEGEGNFWHYDANGRITNW